MLVPVPIKIGQTYKSCPKQSLVPGEIREIKQILQQQKLYTFPKLSASYQKRIKC